LSTAITVAGGPFTDAPGLLERFEEPDTNDGVAAIPLANNVSTVNLIPLTGADMLETVDVFYSLRGTWNGFTGALASSPYFPYNLIQNLGIPYQSGSLKLASTDGHMHWLYQLLRGANAPEQSNYVQQEPLQVTAYSPMANLVSSNAYAAPVAGQPYQLDFNFRVSAARFFRYFYDTDAKGNLLQYENVFVSPFLMSSTGRNSIPTLTLNPLVGGTSDTSLFVHSGSNATPPSWTDNGSLVRFRRRGWRQPANASSMPPLFNWALQIYSTRFTLDSARVRMPLPTEGQLMCMVVRLYDPTLNGGAGGPIPLSNLNEAIVSFGSGIAKYNDTAQSLQDRLIRSHGWLPTEGVLIWDTWKDSGRTNRDVINTYNTASPLIRLDFGAYTPGPGSYADVGLEYLTLVSN
jgi:hypothetical protein